MTDVRTTAAPADHAADLTDELAALLADRGVQGITGIRATGSELDRIVLVDAASGPVVVKESPAGSSSAHLQATLLDAVFGADPGVPAPRVLHAANGDALTTSPTTGGTAFVMTTCPGTPLEDASVTKALVNDLADVQVALLTALADVDPTSASVPESNAWSIDAVVDHAHLIDEVADERHRALLHAAADRYRDELAPVIAGLPRQVVHADFNLSNVLVTDGGITGVIDFGDAVRTARVLDVAVTVCYLGLALGSLEHALVTRYVERIAPRIPLTAAETALVQPLALCRLVIAVVLARDTARREPSRAEYVLRYDAAAVRLLDSLTTPTTAPTMKEA